MSNSHRKRKRRSARASSANTPRRRTPKTPADSSPAPTSQLPADVAPALPPIEVPYIGPPRRKPSRAPLPASPPALPEGALLSVSKSGGFAFSSRELTVYDDGRASYELIGQGRGKPARHELTLSDEQLRGLRAELANLDTQAVSARHTPAPPDGFSYELAARVGDEVVTAQVADGSIPSELTTLMRLLRDLMPNE